MRCSITPLAPGTVKVISRPATLSMLGLGDARSLVRVFRPDHANQTGGNDFAQNFVFRNGHKLQHATSKDSRFRFTLWTNEFILYSKNGSPGRA